MILASGHASQMEGGLVEKARKTVFAIERDNLTD